MGAGGLSPLYGQSSERYAYDETSLRAVLAEIEAASDYRFLYRDALVSGKTVSLNTGADGVLEALRDALRAEGLGMHLDRERRQVLIFKTDAPAPGTTVSGYVVCAETGARLPFATLSWEEEAGRLNGRMANDSGVFHLRVDDEDGALPRRVTASYVGYEAKDVVIGTSNELTIRLHPKLNTSREVVVNSRMLDTELDTTWHSLLEPSVSAPFGEPSVLRALQPLPSVALSGAFNDGPIVRGSRPDGFQVLLDGATIYNYSHFFGLFDVFNEEALQTVGFYYGVAPASMQSPPGGTLSFITRPGSQTSSRQHVGLSNTAVEATAEGPLADGRGSWLLSGRHSYLDAFDWFNNRQIIAHGLGIELFSSFPFESELDPDHRVLLPGEGHARFYDLHGKLQYEWEDGRRLMGNLYAGGDLTRQEAHRLFVQDEELRYHLWSVGSADRLAADFDIPRYQLDTDKNWGNVAGSLHLQQPLSGGRHSRTIVSASRYFSHYAKDDFVYTDIEEEGDAPRHFTERFTSDNDLLDLGLQQELDAPLGELGTWSAGFSANHYRIYYQEATALRPYFEQNQTSTLLDLFGQLDLSNLRYADLHLGLRSHYYSKDNLLRLSPRLHLRVLPERTVSFGMGFSQNHQFLHRLALEHNKTPNIWVMSSREEPPGRVHQGTAGIYLRPSANTSLQVEAFVKAYKNLRQHETVVQSDAFEQAGRRIEPWIPDNTAYARGLEAMLHQRLGPVVWTTSYALSRVDLYNEEHSGGRVFPANWDRRHQLQSQLQGTLTPSLDAHLSWAWASGAPNNLAYSEPDEHPRLPAYHRLDLSLQWRPSIAGIDIETRMGLFNLYDRQNTSYRTPLPILDPEAEDPSVTFMNVDVYDLGFQPSFEVALSF